jgi:hypothetical protein
MSSYLAGLRGFNKTPEQMKQEADAMLYASDLSQNMLFGAMIDGMQGTTEALKGKSYDFSDVREANPTLDSIVKGITLPAGPSTTYRVPEPQPEGLDFLAEVLLDPINYPIASVGTGLFRTGKELVSDNVDTLTANLPNFVPGYYGPNRTAAMAKWLATLGFPAAGRGVLSPRGQALQKETGISAVTQDVIKKGIEAQSKARALPMGEAKQKAQTAANLARSVSVGQAQHNVMTAHMFGSGKLSPELQRVKDLSYATDFMPLSKEAFFLGANKTNAKKGNRAIKPEPAVLDKMYERVLQQWGSELGRAQGDKLPVDLIFKEPTGMSGGHLNDAMSKKVGYTLIQTAFDPRKKLNDLSKTPNGALSYENPQELEKALQQVQRRSTKEGGSFRVLETTDTGVLLKATELKSTSKLEGGMNHLMHVGLKGQVTHLSSDYYDFADKLARKIGVEQFLNNRAKKGVLSVVVPMITDARPERIAKRIINSRTKVKLEDARKSEEKPKFTLDVLEDLTKVKPSEAGVQARKDALRPLKEKGLSEIGLVGMLSIDDERE